MLEGHDIYGGFRYYRLAPKVYVKIEWRYDEDSEPDYLGSVEHDPPSEWYGDRQTGIFYGPEIKEFFIPTETEEEAIRLVEDMEPWGWNVETYDSRYDAEESYGVIVGGAVPLFTDLYVAEYQYTYWRYYVPSENHRPPGHSWNHVREKDLAEVAEEFGGLAEINADISYMVHDWEIFERWRNDDWWYLGLIATVYVDGKEADSSLWGIGSYGFDEATLADYLLSEIGQALHYFEMANPDLVSRIPSLPANMVDALHWLEERRIDRGGLWQNSGEDWDYDQILEQTEDYEEEEEEEEEEDGSEISS